MSESNCIKKGISSKQSHIAITGEQMDLFPYIYSNQFIENDNADMKNFFVLKHQSIYLKTIANEFLKGILILWIKKYLKKKYCIYPRSGGEQIQLSMKQNGDSEKFFKV